MNMTNPKTTIAGYAGLLGTLLVGMGTMLPPSGLATTLHTIGLLLLGGSTGLGNIHSQDGEQ